METPTVSRIALQSGGDGVVDAVLAVDLLTVLLIGLLAYTVLAMTLDREGYLPEWVHVSGPLLTLHTQRGKELLDRMARRKRFWRAWANVGLGITLVVLVLSFLFVVLAAILAVQNPEPQQVTEPRNLVVIPGFNDFLPLSVAPEIVLGLLVGLVVHEGGHGLLCRVEGIEIKSMGLALVSIVPLGAFVEPDEESQRGANRGGRARMFAAGVTNNFLVTVLAFGLLFGPVTGSIAVASGAAIGGSLSDSPADGAGIGSGDRIVAVGGEPVDSGDELRDALANETDRTVTIETADGQERRLERRLLVTGALVDSGVDPGSRITHVEGVRTDTIGEFDRRLAAVGERTTLTIENDSATYDHEIVVGGRVAVRPGGPLSSAGAPSGEDMTVVSIGEHRVRDNEDLGDAIDAQAPDDTVELVAYREGERRTFDVRMGESGGDAYLGVGGYSGVDGLTVDDLGVRYYPADRYLAALGGPGDDQGAVSDSFVGKTFTAVFLPIAGIAGSQSFPFNFAGFTDDVRTFYVVEGPLAFLGEWVFALATALFWIGWVNINLGFFNCIPAFPLDGGHILRTGVESVVSRLPVEQSHLATKAITISVGLTMGLGLVIMVFGPRYLF